MQAGVYSAPTTAKARKVGMVELLDLNYVPFNANAIIVRREMLDDPKGRDALTRFMKATAEGIARVRQDKAFALQVLQKYLKEDDREALDEVYTAYLPKRVPLVLPDALPPVLESIAERRSGRPEPWSRNATTTTASSRSYRRRASSTACIDKTSGRRLAGHQWWRSVERRRGADPVYRFRGQAEVHLAERRLEIAGAFHLWPRSRPVARLARRRLRGRAPARRWSSACRRARRASPFTMTRSIDAPFSQ